MRENKKVQELYKKHTQHIERDVSHLGDAENYNDVIDFISSFKPNVYMLARCCTDGVYTL